MKLRPDRKEIRQKEAKERQAAYDKLTPEQKIARLDELHGVGRGATKERKRLENEML